MARYMRRTSSVSVANGGSGATMPPFASSVCLYSTLNSATVGIGGLCQGGASSTMPAGEILLRLHLDETAGRTLELQCQALAVIERGGRRRGRDHDLHAAVIKLVDQHDEAPRRI